MRGADTRHGDADHWRSRRRIASHGSRTRTPDDGYAPESIARRISVQLGTGMWFMRQGGSRRGSRRMWESEKRGRETSRRGRREGKPRLEEVRGVCKVARRVQTIHSLCRASANSDQETFQQRVRGWQEELADAGIGCRDAAQNQLSSEEATTKALQPHDRQSRTSICQSGKDRDSSSNKVFNRFGGRRVQGSSNATSPRRSLVESERLTQTGRG
eukprot:1972691-Rhodomonas_salina.1